MNKNTLTNKIIIFILIISSILLIMNTFSRVIETLSKNTISIDTSLSKQVQNQILFWKRNAVNLNYEGINAQLGLGHLYRKYGLKERSDEEYKQLISMADQIIQISTDTPLIETAYWYKGIAYGKLQQYDRGIQTIDEFFKQYQYARQYLYIKLALIDLLCEQENYERALKECDVLIENYPRCKMDDKTFSKYTSSIAKNENNEIDSGARIEGLKKKALIYDKMKDNNSKTRIYQEIISILSVGKYTTNDWQEYRKRQLQELQSKALIDQK